MANPGDLEESSVPSFRWLTLAKKHIDMQPGNEVDDDQSPRVEIVEHQHRRLCYVALQRFGVHEKTRS
jgi:hypothetical protein